MKEIGSRRVEVASSGHTWHGADVGVVEGHRALRQSLEVWRVGPVTAVGRQEVPVQRVEHDDDGFDDAGFIDMANFFLLFIRFFFIFFVIMFII